MPIKCAICTDPGFEDQMIYALNPLTFRMGTMHRDCWLIAYDDLADQRASDTVNFSSRQDEYDQKVA